MRLEGGHAPGCCVAATLVLASAMRGEHGRGMSNVGVCFVFNPCAKSLLRSRSLFL